jgi:DNA-binding NtrC family response regulator
MNTIQIHLPPLRERTDDIEDLALHYLKTYGKKYDKPDIGLADDAVDKLRRNPWYGNIRELQHTMEKAVILSEGDSLHASDFILVDSDVAPLNQTETLEDLERKAIISTLKKNNFNQGLSADQLGITRQTLYNKIKKYGV